jgi:hypothetical protein
MILYDFSAVVFTTERHYHWNSEIFTVVYGGVVPLGRTIGGNRKRDANRTRPDVGQKGIFIVCSLYGYRVQYGLSYGQNNPAPE